MVAAVDCLRRGACGRGIEFRLVGREGLLADRTDAAPGDPLSGQPQIGVVGPQRQAELGARGEHPIRLATPCVVRSSTITPKIGFGPVEPDDRLPAGDAGGVDAGDQPLRAGFLITGRAVDLARQEQARQRPQLQPATEGARIDVVIFHRIAGPDHPRVLQARDGAQDRLLHILRQAGGDAVGVDRGIVQALRLQEDVVPLLVGEADDLVLDRWAVTRPAPAIWPE